MIFRDCLGVGCHTSHTRPSVAVSKDANKGPERLNQRVLKQLRLEKGLIHTSGKMVLLDKLLPKLRSEGHKVCVRVCACLR